MTTDQPFRTLDDLHNELVSGGMTHRDAALQLIREFENGEIILHGRQTSWAAENAAVLIVEFLQSVANWKPRSRPPTQLFGSAKIIANLRFRKVVPQSRPRKGAGRKEQHDWVEAELCALRLLNERGDPTCPLDATKGWRSKTDLAEEVRKHLEKQCVRTGEAPPSPSAVRSKAPVWIATYRAQK